ncbi:ABC transporter ATP-binding protein [Nocardioides montaniterrae]
MSAGTIESGAELGALDTIRRGFRHSPELSVGLRLTTLFAVIASIGQVVVPIAVQQTLDRAVDAPHPMAIAAAAAAICLVALLLTSYANYLMTARLYVASERGLATLRTTAFRHVHDLPLLTQNTERRGALVSRVTSDVDQISQFLVNGGLLLVISIGQILVATVVMAVYSWVLALVVWLAFLPLFLSLQWFQKRLSVAYAEVRARVGAMLGVISEPVVGAAVVKAYAIEERTQVRIDEAVNAARDAQTRAQRYSVVSFSLGGLCGGLANIGVVLGGVWLSDHSGLTPRPMSVGTILAFAFLVSLFVNPVQLGTQILTDAQNALASWRRVIGILETPADLVDPGESGTSLPDGPVDVRFEGVAFAYPGGTPVLRDIDLDIPAGRRVAVVGETGSGKSTLAKLLTRLMDPTTGTVRLDGVDLREVREDSLRRSVVLVPQEGFLFDDTLAANARYGRIDATDAAITAAADELGLGDWLAGLPAGLATEVGQRGESLSAGERQLVALIRAQLADPDLLVLDEATSAVDPELEMRIGRALERLMRGRTSVTIAHRLSTAEAADEVVVVDEGRIVQRGPHAELARQAGSVYAGLHASWTAQQG